MYIFCNIVAWFEIISTLTGIHLFKSGFMKLLTINIPSVLTNSSSTMKHLLLLAFNELLIIMIKHISVSDMPATDNTISSCSILKRFSKSRVNSYIHTRLYQELFHQWWLPLRHVYTRNNLQIQTSKLFLMLSLVSLWQFLTHKHQTGWSLITISGQ